MKLTRKKLKEIIREELLREVSFKKLIIPNDTKTKKLVSNMIKQMKSLISGQMKWEVFPKTREFLSVKKKLFTSPMMKNMKYKLRDLRK